MGIRYQNFGIEVALSFQKSYYSLGWIFSLGNAVFEKSVYKTKPKSY